MQNDPIWAPWRLAYVQGGERPQPDQQPENLLPGADPKCFICRAVAASDDESHWVVYRGDHVVVMLNRYPYNNGHLLVAPQHHLARPDQLSDELHLELARTTTRMIGILEKTIHPDGFNVGLNLGRVAGAGLPGHLHWHVVPRWTGDTNFMPTVAAVHVIPQALEALWELLVAELRQPEPS